MGLSSYEIDEESNEGYNDFVNPRIAINQQKLADVCRRYDILRLSFFGSVLTDDFHKESDVDVLVEFKAGKTPGFIKIHQLEEELSKILDDKKIDLVTVKSLNPRIRGKIISEAVLQYEEG